jgi:hypothetical protein
MLRHTKAFNTLVLFRYELQCFYFLLNKKTILLQINHSKAIATDPEIKSSINTSELMIKGNQHNFIKNINIAMHHSLARMPTTMQSDHYRIPPPIPHVDLRKIGHY